MKIEELQLLAYGPFTDASLDLSGGDFGLHIVYGPNEAGKSSTLRAIHGLLYGIRTNTSDNFLHANKKLLIGGRLSNRDGSQLHFHRRKGNKSTLLNPAGSKGSAFPDDVLDPFVRGIDADCFARVYGIGNEQLEAGGHEMAALRGLVGESLFAATVGPGLAALIKQIDDEATGIYHPRKQNASLKQLARRYDDHRKERRSVQLARSSWEKLQSTLATAREGRDAIVARERELNRQLQRLKRVENGLSLIARLRETMKRIDELAGASVLPESYSAEERSKAEIELANLRRQIGQVSAAVTGPDGHQAQLKRISVPEGLLEFEDSINELKDRRAVSISAETDRTRLAREMQTLVHQANETLADLGFDGGLDAASELRVPTEDQIRIRNLGNDARRLREEPARLEDQLAELKQVMRQDQNELEGLEDSVDFEAVRAVLEDSARAGHYVDQLDELQRQSAQLKHSIDGHLETIGLWKGTIRKVRSQSMPLAETVERFRDRLADLTVQQSQLVDERIVLQREFDEVRQSIAALETEGSVPTEAELQQLRSDRDMCWQKVRDDWLLAFFNKSMPVESAEQLAAEYTRAVSSADQMADRLRRETERVTKLAGFVGRRQILEEQLQRNEDSSSKIEESRKDADKEWVKLWKSVSVASPLSPSEMLEWLRRFAALQTTVRDFDELAAKLDELNSRVAAVLNELTAALTASGAKPTKRIGKDLAALQRFAKKVVADHEQQKQRRAELTAAIARTENEIDRLSRANQRAANELTEWQGLWSESMAAIGCQPDALPEQANDRIDKLNHLFEIARRVQEAQLRMDEIDEQAKRFESDVAELTARFLVDTTVVVSNPVDGTSEAVSRPKAARELTATDAAIELHASLQVAKADQARFESISEALHNANAELMKLKEAEGDWVTRLELLCQLAGVTDTAALPVKERESSELSKLGQRRAELEEQLHEQSGGLSVEEFIADAESVDADELPSEMETLENEIARLQDDREAAAVAVAELESQAAEADGNDKAAMLDQQGLGVLSTMHDEARLYMRLRLAGTMLRKQIDIHRSENEDPLLERASGLFSTMTCGEYVGLRTDYDQDQPVIVGQRDTEELVPVAGMSDGTRNQLYLALRLGYVEHQLMKFEPMPFIVDDILVHFDDTRATATLKVLAELSRQTQVIFLTHHQHLVGLAETNLPADQLFVHNLDSRNRVATGRRTPTTTRPR